jgi:hypothetical protein
MAEGIEHAEPGQSAVRGDEVVGEFAIDWGRRCSARR